MRLFIAGAVATVVMGLATSTAGASRGASVVNGVTLFTANGNVTIAKQGITTTCTLTLGIALNRSIAKMLLAEIGQVLLTPVSRFTNCNLSVTGVILNNIRIGYVGFTGTLPNITTIAGRANNFAFLVQLPIIGSCLYLGSLSTTFARNTATGAIDSIALSANGTLLGQTPGCPTPASLTGTLTVLPTKPIVSLT